MRISPAPAPRKIAFAQLTMQRIELLALRKAAQSHPSRPTTDDGRETESSTPVPTGNKAKGKKTKGRNAAVPTSLLSTPTPGTASALGPKVLLGAMLRGNLPELYHIPGSSARITSALDAADALIELLAADPTSVSADLVLSTTFRAFQAVQTVTSRILARHGPSGSCTDSDLTTQDSAAKLGLLAVLLHSLVSNVVLALQLQHSTAIKYANKKKTSKKGAQAARVRAEAARAALDDLCGGIYELVLCPAVRAFVPLSEGYLLACLDPENSASCNAIPDLRPDVFAMLESVLAVLESSPVHLSTPMRVRPHATSPAAITGSDELKALLALECTRELHSIYLPPNGPEAPPGAPSDSPSQAYSRLQSRTASTPDSQAVPGHAARRGTVAASPVLPLPFQGHAAPRASTNLGETAREYVSGQANGAVRGQEPDGGGNNVRAGAVSGSDGKGTRARIARLARKDAGWWLCAVLDRMLVSSPGLALGSGDRAGSGHAASTPDDGLTGTTGHAGNTGSDIAHQAVYDALADLLRRTRPYPGLARRASASLAPSPSPRGHSPNTSNHAQERSGSATGLPSTGAETEKHQAEPHSQETVGSAGNPELNVEKTRAGARSAGARDRRAHAGDAGARMDAQMSEVERGMLLAVLERAWLG
ncbi:hypothetical protein BC628DRAFT_844936 [Trametes gibbosa]|nr:hypothetical protein BC628DRAFT_844936 [Trametes gibbosa]